MGWLPALNLSLTLFVIAAPGFVEGGYGIFSLTGLGLLCLLVFAALGVDGLIRLLCSLGRRLAGRSRHAGRSWVHFALVHALVPVMLAFFYSEVVRGVPWRIASSTESEIAPWLAVCGTSL